MKKLSFACILSLIIGLAAIANAEWHYGVGTGLFRLNVDGDQGFNTALLGPVEFDVDLDPDDVSDLMESAFGIGGYATDGQWVINVSTAYLKLQGDASRTFPGGSVVSAEIYQEVISGALSVGYVVLREKHLILRPYVGVRYTKHEIGGDLSISAPIGPASVSRDVDHNWVDARLGLATDVPINSEWVWSSSLEAGYGGSDGTYVAETGVTYRFADHWATRLYGNFTAVDYENGDKGDSDWYLYDANEYGLGLTVLYLW